VLGCAVDNDLAVVRLDDLSDQGEADAVVADTGGVPVSVREAREQVLDSVDVQSDAGVCDGHRYGVGHSGDAQRYLPAGTFVGDGVVEQGKQGTP